MKMTFRWYGESDSIPLSYIRQIPGMSGVVTAVYDVPVGQEWPLERLLKLKEMCSANGLEMEVIESVPVHEDIKLGLPSRDKYIDAYCRNIINCGKAGVKCICYNFMPVFDWVRTDLAFVHDDDSVGLKYDAREIRGLDAKNLHLPGWDESYSPQQLQALLDAYKEVDENKLFDNMVYFLKAVMPACEKADVNMAVHPDDPPWNIFGLPRIISRDEQLEKLFAAVPDKHNGLTLCTGSLGADENNNLPAMAEKYGDRIYFAHLRQIKHYAPGSFYENGHLTSMGDVDMYAVVKALVKAGGNCYVRSDHGRNVWGENAKPGYGLYDRAMGACYLTGLFEAIQKDLMEEKL